jgi:2-aminoadipate transaminase
VWATLPDYFDTTDLLARALRDNVAFVPGAAAYADGRGSGSMRLNFSGSTEEEIREGIARIGEVVSEQVELFESLTHKVPPASSQRSGDPGEAGIRPGAAGSNEGRTSGDVVPFRRQAE